MRILLIVFIPMLLASCFNPKMMVDNRTAIEQELTRGAIFRAVNQLPIIKQALDGRWKIELASADKTDDSWTRTLLRQHLVTLGADIPSKAADALPVIEAVVQFAGTDIDSFVLGVPIPGTLGESSISFYHDNGQRGRARIYLNFWTSEGKLLATSPAFSGETHYTDVTFLIFIGPFSFTDLDDLHTYGRLEEHFEDKWDRSVRAMTESDETAADTWIIPNNTKQPKSWSKYIQY